MKVILSADSTCDLSNELKAEYNVVTIPYHIILGGKEYIDNVDITPDDLYRAYREEKLLPTTAAINVQEYIDYFEPFVKDGCRVIHFCLGSALSSSYRNAVLAAEELGNVFVIDSCNLSTAIGLQIIDCRNMLDAGKTCEEISKYFSENAQKYHTSFILDTLEFMKAGGRCSAVTAFGASVLSLKIGIEVDNTCGSMGVGKKYRGSLKNVLAKYVQDKLEKYPDIKTDKVFITHSGIDEEIIELVRESIEKTIHFDKVYVAKASCTVSCHCGPNTLGVLFATESSCK